MFRFLLCVLALSLFKTNLVLAGNDDMKHNKETVVLLHGIGHCKWNMFFLERVLKARGYKTLNLTYPSLSKEIKPLSKWLKERLEKEKIWDNTDKIHFVEIKM